MHDERFCLLVCMSRELRSGKQKKDFFPFIFMCVFVCVCDVSIAPIPFIFTAQRAKGRRWKKKEEAETIFAFLTMDGDQSFHFGLLEAVKRVLSGCSTSLCDSTT